MDQNQCQFCLPLIQRGRVAYTISYENRKFNIGNWWIKLRMPIYPIFRVYVDMWWFNTIYGIRIWYVKYPIAAKSMHSSASNRCSIRTPLFRFIARFAGCGLCQTNETIDYAIVTWVVCVLNVFGAHFTFETCIWIMFERKGKWTILNLYVINISLSCNVFTDENWN